MSLYGEYIKEREGKDIIENNEGFVTFEIDSPYVFVQDLFITKESRGKGIATKMVNKVEKLALEKGCTELYCNLDLNSDNWEDSLNFFIKYGVKFHRKDKDGYIYFKKSIGEK